MNFYEIENRFLEYNKPKLSTKTLLNVGYTNQEGVLKNDNYKRYLVRLNQEIDISKNIKVGGDITGYFYKFNPPAASITNALWAGAELIDKKSEEDVHHVTVKMLRQNKPNDLFQAVINHAEILSFNEVVPSMNDIFISVVENKTTVNTQSSFTE